MPPVLAIGGKVLAAVGAGSAVKGAVTVGAVAANAISSKKAGDKAAAATVQSTQDANAVLRETRDLNIERLKPYGEGAEDALELARTISGANGVEAQKEYYDNFEFSPYSEFQRKEALKYIDQASMGAGTLRSGSRLKSISEYINGLSSAEVGNNFNRNMSIADMGLRADAAAAGVATNAANQVSDNTIYAGQVESQKHINRSRAFQSGVADLYGAWAS